MKKQFFILLFLIFSGLLTQAQEEEYEYTPFPDSNAIWSEYYSPPLSSDESPSYHALALFNEDTVINSIKYQKLFRLYDTVLNREHAEYVGAIREDSAKRVYYKGEPLKYLMPANNFNDNNEILLYDFSVKEGDTLFTGNFIAGNKYIVINQIDTIEIAGSYRRIIKLEYPWIEWIEGIGNIRGLLFCSGDLPTNGVNNDLICFKHQEKKEYFNNEFTSCFPEVLNVGVEEFDKGTQVKVYPNPASSVIFFEKLQNYSLISIYSNQGNLLLKKSIKNGQSISFNLEFLPPEIYFYKISNDHMQFLTGKFIIQ